jgi:hypothetical protein
MKSLEQLSRIITWVVAGVLIGWNTGMWQPSAWAAPKAKPPSQIGLLSQPANMEAACSTGRTVQVSGSAAVNVRPDRVLIQLGVTSHAVTPEQVEADNTTTIRRIVEAVRELGIPEKDMATDYYVIYPIYVDYDNMTIEGYRINNQIAITLTDIDLTSDVLIAALKAGANEVQNVQFYTSELRRYRDQARELAMTAATEKAQALAQAGGSVAGCVLQINENTWSYYQGSWWGGRDRAMWTQNVVQNTASEGQPSLDETPISVGQIVVKAEVSASFSLE